MLEFCVLVYFIRTLKNEIWVEPEKSGTLPAAVTCIK